MRRDTIKLADMTVFKYVFDPAWQWSKHNKPIIKTNSCQVHHFGVFISGKMRVKADDGQEMEFGPGDVADIPPGHDGWVLGDEPVVYYEFVCKTN
jgi:quercetin dioxygenase-like cupin family protein